MKLQKNQKGIAHHLLLAGVAVLVLGAVGFAGFRVYKSKNDVSAKAAGWTTIRDSSFEIARACKIYQPNGTYIVKIYVQSKQPTGYYYGVAANTGNGTTPQTANFTRNTFTFYNVKSNMRAQGGAYHPGGDIIVHGKDLSVVGGC